MASAQLTHHLFRKGKKLFCVKFSPHYSIRNIIPALYNVTELLSHQKLIIQDLLLNECVPKVYKIATPHMIQ